MWQWLQFQRSVQPQNVDERDPIYINSFISNTIQNTSQQKKS
jgi:hypothetical protein